MNAGGGNLDRAMQLAAAGKFDEAYAEIRKHYQERLARGREADRDYKLLHLLMLAAEARNSIDPGGGAGDISHNRHGTNSTRS